MVSEPRTGCVGVHVVLKNISLVHKSPTEAQHAVNTAALKNHLEFLLGMVFCPPIKQEHGSVIFCGFCPKSNTGFYILNGIDRINNNRGYEEGNVVSCCKTCNRAKDILSVDEFINWATSVARNYRPKVNVESA
jgi:hypothetical protein